MADKSVASKAPRMMIVINTPAGDLVLGNLAYCHPSDLTDFHDPRTDSYFASVGNRFVVSIISHDGIRPGHIALNAIQRSAAQVSVGEPVLVGRYIPPAKFDLELLSLELGSLNGGTESEQLDRVVLATQLKKEFHNQVLKVGQSVPFKHYGKSYIFRVTKAVVEGQENSESDPESQSGLLSANTCIAFEALKASGIEIVDQCEASTSKVVRDKMVTLESCRSLNAANQFQGASASFITPYGISKLRLDIESMLLYGPSRTGKQVPFQIGKMLIRKEPKIDSMESLKNVPLAGITNGKKLLDRAPLRLEQLDAQVEISFLDESERLLIFQNCTNKMRENSMLSPDVNLQELAACTENYNEIEIKSAVRNAALVALNRQISLDGLSKPIDEEGIKVAMEDIQEALRETTPAFGASTNDLEACRLNGMVDCGDWHELIRVEAMLLVTQLRVGKEGSLVTCLLEGPAGSGKTAMAATIGIDSAIPYVKIVSAVSMICLPESTKLAQITKVFEDAYKSPYSVIIVDDIERLLEYVAIGPCFSNLLAEKLVVLLKQVPPKGKKLLVIGTTSEMSFLDSIGIGDAFSVTYHVPTLGAEDSKKVLQQLDVFAEEDVDAAAEALNEMPIKKLYTAVQMAARRASGDEKIDIESFYKCLEDMPKY